MKNNCATAPPRKNGNPSYAIDIMHSRKVQSGWESRRFPERLRGRLNFRAINGLSEESTIYCVNIGTEYGMLCARRVFSPVEHPAVAVTAGFFEFNAVVFSGQGGAYVAVSHDRAGRTSTAGFGIDDQALA